MLELDKCLRGPHTATGHTDTSSPESLNVLTILAISVISSFMRKQSAGRAQTLTPALIGPRPPVPASDWSLELLLDPWSKECQDLCPACSGPGSRGGNVVLPCPRWRHQPDPDGD